MRVIAGKAKGRKLKTVPGSQTRPITDRVKESLFNILGADIVGASFLDLFAGTGSVGIEALSREASYALFVDRSRSAIATVRANLKRTGLSERAEVIIRDAFLILQAGSQRPFDYIYIAPPQYQGMWSRILEILDADPSWLSPDAWVIVQIHPVEYQPQRLKNLVEFNQRRYGSTLLVFYERPQG